MLVDIILPVASIDREDVPVRTFVLLTLIPATVILLVLLEGLFARPIADDFCYASVFKDKGFWSSLPHWREHINSRDASTFVLYVFSSRFDILQQYWVIPPFTMTLLWLGMTAFFSVFLRVSIAALWSIFLLGIYLSAITGTESTIFWAPGAITYQWGGSFSLILFALILQPRFAKQANEIVFTLLCVLTAAWTTLFSELVGLGTLGVLTLLLLNKQIREARLQRIVYPAATILLVLVYMFLGNAIGKRLDASASSQDVLYALTRSPLKGLQFSVPIALVMIMLGLITPVARALSNVAAGMCSVFGEVRGRLALLLLFLFPTLSYFILFYSLGVPGPSRAHSLNYLWALCIWPFCHLAFRPKLVTISRLVGGTFRQCIYGTVLIGLLIMALNPARYIEDLFTGKGADYAAGMDKRYRTLQDAARSPQSVVVPRVKSAKAVGFEGLGAEWTDVGNVCTARYFGVKHLRLESD